MSCAPLTVIFTGGEWYCALRSGIRRMASGIACGSFDKRGKERFYFARMGMEMMKTLPEPRVLSTRALPP